MPGNGTASSLAFTGAVRDVQHLRDLPLRIGPHRPSQRGPCFGAEPRLYRQQKYDAIPRRITGGGQVPQNGPLLDRAHNLGWFALHQDSLVAAVYQLIW